MSTPDEFKPTEPEPEQQTSEPSQGEIPEISSRPDTPEPKDVRFNFKQHRTLPDILE
ncbi:MAG: hypothetical protein ABI430_00220 [Candidatus Taylorbacteria bacterium]